MKDVTVIALTNPKAIQLVQARAKQENRSNCNALATSIIEYLTPKYPANIELFNDFNGIKPLGTGKNT